MMIRLTILLSICTFVFAQSFSLEKNDSIFARYSIDQIVDFRKYIEERINRNITKRDELNARGLKVNKSVLESKASIGANQDIMLLRLAEFYIDEADEKFFSKSDKYDKEFEVYVLRLEKFEADSVNNYRPDPPGEISRDYSKPLEMYDRILTEFPNSDLTDEALYSKGYLLKEEGRGAESRIVFSKLIKNYSKSPFAPYAISSLAGYYFEPDEYRDEIRIISDLKKSISLYRSVLKYKDFDRYDEALYRLAWACYRLAAVEPSYYNDAILYFTLALDDIYNGKKYKIAELYTNANIREEAIRYIGISFSQEDNPKQGVAQLRKYVKKLILLNKKFAPEVMKSLGDVYYEIREDKKTIEAYTAFQDLFPYDRDAASIQKRIVEAYRVYDEKIDYRSDSRSFEERYKMFKKFHSKSEWYRQLLASDAPNKFVILQDAEKNSERALLTNIQLIYKDIVDKELENLVKVSDYEILVQMCQEYLDFFPNFDNAFQVHSSYAEILDTKLHRYSRAYEEYIESSNIYPSVPLDRIKSIAYNAVIVADTLRAIAGDKDITLTFDSSGSMKAEPLTASEKRQIEAYENYIKISPTDSNAANFLFNISAIYFNRKQFSNANRYSKTLLLRFPSDQGKALARQQVLNGYYARGQYLSAEAVARGIINDPSADPAHVDEAKERLFDSILKNAEAYQKVNKHYIAGLEFRRAGLDAPFEKRKNYRLIAFYNSGNEFEKVRDLEEANDSYNYILREKEKSNVYTYKALVNLAFNYKDLDQNKFAAEYFEKLYLDYPDSTDSKKYLENAGASYQRSESWLDAIRVNYKYANTYPGDDASKNYLFNNAEFYLKLDDFENANRIYSEFATKYPNDSRIIESHYKQGEYHLGKGAVVRAREEFTKAIKKNEQFKAEKKKVDNFYASEAAFGLIQLQEAEYDAIVFKWPKSNINLQRERKIKKLNEVKDSYEKLISYGSSRSLEAPYKIAILYEKFAEIFVTQELDPNEKNQAKLIKAEGEIRATAGKLYEKSISKYQEAITDIKKIAKKLKINLNDDVKKSSVDSFSGAKQLKSSKKISMDSLRNVANNFIYLSKRKITNVIFLLAKQSERNIANALNYKSQYTGKAGKESLDLLVKDEVLKKAVTFSVNASIKMHRRNLEMAKKLKVNTKYVDESKRRILVNSNIIADEYAKLSNLSLSLFDEYYKEYIALIPRPFGRKSPVFGKDYPELFDNLGTFLEYATDFISKSLGGYKKAIEVARKDSIKNDLFEYIEKSILEGPLEFVKDVVTISDAISEKKSQFEKIFKSLSDEIDVKYNYEDAKGNLEDILFVLRDTELDGLDAAFTTSKELELPVSPAYARILRMLIKLDPVTYAGQIAKTEITYVSDETWKVSNVLNDSINELNYDDSSWRVPVVISDTIPNQAFDTLKVKSKAIWYSENSSSSSEIDSSAITNLPSSYVDSVSNTKIYYYEKDSLGNPIALEIDTITGYPINFVAEYFRSSLTTDTLDTVQVYFRKKMYLGGKLYSAKYIGTGDGEVNLFINKELITTFSSENYGDVDLGDQSLFGEFLRVGENMLAIWVKDKGKPRKGLKFSIIFEVLPKEFMENFDDVINETTLLSNADEKRVQTFFKNRVVTKSLRDYISENIHLKKSTSMDTVSSDKGETNLNKKPPAREDTNDNSDKKSEKNKNLDKETLGEKNTSEQNIENDSSSNKQEDNNTTNLNDEIKKKIDSAVEETKKEEKTNEA